MAILIVDYNGARQAGTLNGRVLIGRWPANTIVIDDRAVSRIHAWVGVQHGHYYVADTGSRTGTFVNGRPLTERHVLSDEDQIQIGQAIFHYLTNDLLPEGALEIDLTPRSADELSGTHGVFMDCECGAPLWLPVAFTGSGQCRYCGHMVRLRGPVSDPGPPPVPPELHPRMAMPTPPPAPPVARNGEAISPPIPRIKSIPPSGRRVPPPAPIQRIPIQKPAIPMPPAPLPEPEAPVTQEPAQETVCGACHSAITIFDEVTKCPSCGLMFHTDCWTENRGCSAYGCSQVGALE